MLKDSMNNDWRHIMSRDLPYVPQLTEYLWLLVGVGVTVFIQSSSIITSALIPLVSTKIITLGNV